MTKSERLRRYEQRKARGELQHTRLWLFLGFGSLAAVLGVQGGRRLPEPQGWGWLVAGLAAGLLAWGALRYRAWVRWPVAVVLLLGPLLQLTGVGGQIGDLWDPFDILRQGLRTLLGLFLVLPSTGRLFALARGEPVDSTAPAARAAGAGHENTAAGEGADPS